MREIAKFKPKREVIKEVKDAVNNLISKYGESCWEYQDTEEVWICDSDWLTYLFQIECELNGWTVRVVDDEGNIIAERYFDSEIDWKELSSMYNVAKRDFCITLSEAFENFSLYPQIIEEEMELVDTVFNEEWNETIDIYYNPESISVCGKEVLPKGYYAVITTSSGTYQGLGVYRTLEELKDDLLS